MTARLSSMLLGVATLALATPSWAFCRATTCDPSKDLCARDSGQCLITGMPLTWASSCIQVYVQANGSPKQGLSFDDVKGSLTRAFAAWTGADCGGGAVPLLDVQVLGPIGCDQSEYNQTQKNANIVMFRDDEWPYIGGEDALGFTDLHFNADTGELWDADIEINSVTQHYSVGTPVNGADLDSVLTHETGHLLGLAHTLTEEATMFASYKVGTDTLATLADDDVQAVCAAYPPDRVPSRTSCAPRHGFSDQCSADQPVNSATDEGTNQASAGESGSGDTTTKGCAISTLPVTRAWSWPLLAFGACAVSLVRRRSRRHQFVSCEHPRRQR